MTIDSTLHPPLRIASLFSGIGGFELGMGQAGHRTVLMCESDPYADAVLRERFPDVEIAPDVTTLASLPECDIVTAGWPCQDISQAGRTQGLGGDRSGLISEVFRLIASMPRKPRFVLLENVAFAVELRKAEAVRYVTEQLESLGYRWAYRILNTRMFGIPQRRRRLYVLAALDVDPADVLFDGLSSETTAEPEASDMVGFYWTEGNRGLGWSPNAVPPLKGGSSVGIPSPPAVWNKAQATFTTPGIEDAERLQGFPAGWTTPAEALPRGQRKRWMLVGNAVSVPVVKWIGMRLGSSINSSADLLSIQSRGEFTRAGKGGPNETPSFFAPTSEGPGDSRVVALSEFGLQGSAPLSRRALAGFTKRFEVAPLRKNPEFLRDLRRSLSEVEAE